jgi:hypothetical protein
MKKEYWINNILQSASEINEVEANPFLLEKINTRLSVRDEVVNSTVKYKLGWALAIALIIALNVSTLLIYSLKDQKQNEAASVNALTAELSSNTTYNY